MNKDEFIELAVQCSQEQLDAYIEWLKELNAHSTKKVAHGLLYVA